MRTADQEDPLSESIYIPANHLAVSIVLHKSPIPILQRCLANLQAALVRLLETQPRMTTTVVLVDNASGRTYIAKLHALIQAFGFPVVIHCNDGNLGYGAGHNQAQGKDVDFRLILNPDVFLEPNALVRALAFLAANPDVGLVVPHARDERGRQLYLCKRYPTVLVLALRGGAPPWLQKRFSAYLEKYEMRDLDWSVPRFDLQLISGCCFLIRETVWRAIGGFDPGYFLYFEDFDLGLRARRVTRLAYLPDFVVTHLGGGVARKGWRHRVWFVASAWRFFQRYGWRWV
ncbi:hypothetical protein MIT9_P0224 [Methylomarinovum caldicuralii]|uniref:Glycosyl transferase n=1 Tax=Methylomarinovum caldicuralii TaxID=438856 RepID=A0AAU9BWR7_9GAMM|nr:glycosyltransferase family 2 protein [Methylomarinovum caldicuralii]BCX80650.1 hypothetical protein MIT9_P0224 [Methylomarinovum caldicuralii]